jgi:hypothetical protein
VPFETVDATLFANLQQVIVHDGGHTAAFACDPELHVHVRRWLQKAMAQGGG